VTTAARSYRPDIDGLRAVAIMSVLLFHLGFAWIPGGFVGVDIFFVISGYLIGAIVLEEAAQGHLAIARFYARRMRRIVPALAVLLALMFVLAYQRLFPTEFIAFARSAIGAALSVSNIYFLLHTGYFDPAASAQPLLHTWSLAVEEQFYLVFPPFILATRAWARQWCNMFLLLAWAASLAASIVAVQHAPESAFYLPQYRAWELLTGVLATHNFASLRGAWQRNVASATGAGLMGIAIFLYTSETRFPGAAALLPCLGAALVIVAGKTGPSAVCTLLASRPMRFIGLISYSLYLWHWPIIVFQHSSGWLVEGASPTVSRLAVLLCSFVAAKLSWRYVEQPWRHAWRGAPDRRVILAGGFALACVLIPGLLVVGAGGLSFRYPPQAVRDASYLEYGQAHFRAGSCFIVPPYRFADFNAATCLARQGPGPTYLLLGDSHAAHLYAGLHAAMPGANILQATASGCRPVLHQPRNVSPSCAALMNYVFTQFLPAARIDLVLLSARWGEKDLAGLGDVLAWARQRHIHILLFGPMVEYDLALPRLLALGETRHSPDLAAAHVRDQAALEKTLRAMATGEQAEFVSLHDLLCHGPGCTERTPDGAPLLFDADHLTRAGSVLVAHALHDSNAL
jgi:peptidoglycan/LPS O-acetylase OafA/YrhL